VGVTTTICAHCELEYRAGTRHFCPGPGKADEPKDAINPDHYKVGGIETIDYMQAKMSPEGFEGYLQGNVLKYTSRYAHKNGLEDLEKAKWYLSRLIEVYGRFKT
jgi:hypothetical protein